MKARTKSALILLATFLIGGVVGALISGAVVSQRLENLEGLRTGFPRFMERIIEPGDEVQAAQIRAILGHTGQRIGSLRRAYYAELSSVVDSMRQQLYPVLTDEQKARLDAFFTRDRREAWKKRQREGPGLRHPGREGPPPGKHP